MIEKTRAVVLHQLKYTDSGVIIRTYTREFGRQSMLIRGMRGKKSGKHNVYLQPLFILDLDFYYKESRSVQMAKEFTVSYMPLNIYSDVIKSTIAVFLGEVLTSVLKEESPNYELFDYIENSVRYFDESRKDYSNFHIAFLIGLSSFLGFEPGIRTSPGDRYFDLLNGIFVPVPPSHSDFADREISDLLAAFFPLSFDTMGSLPLTGVMRNAVLETLVRYYAIHLPGLKKINSLGVLKEIFR